MRYKLRRLQLQRRDELLLATGSLPTGACAQAAQLSEDLRRQLAPVDELLGRWAPVRRWPGWRARSPSARFCAVYAISGGHGVRSLETLPVTFSRVGPEQD